MKTTDFIKEDIVSDAAEMHQDHEVQMARKDCYTAADDAIALHKLLRNISESQGIEGWVAAKITLAADYLGTVREHLEYELMSAQGPMADVLDSSQDLAEDGGTSSGGIATSMGGGNGFANGGPGTVKRVTIKKPKK